MKKLLVVLLTFLTITACNSNDTGVIEVQKVEYNGFYYDYQDFNYFLEKHGYNGGGSYIDEGNDLDLRSATTSSFKLTEDRSIDVTFLNTVKYDLKTMPVKDSADCDMTCDDILCVCDLSSAYIRVDNMLFNNEDSDIAEYTRSEGMKKYSEETKYKVITIDDFLSLLSSKNIQFQTNELETDIELAIAITNAKLERLPIVACVEIITDEGRFNLYQLFENPYDPSADYALRYQRSYFDGDEMKPLYNLGIWIDNLVLEVLTADEKIINTFRSANW